ELFERTGERSRLKVSSKIPAIGRDLHFRRRRRTALSSYIHDTRKSIRAVKNAIGALQNLDTAHAPIGKLRKVERSSAFFGRNTVDHDFVEIGFATTDE